MTDIVLVTGATGFVGRQVLRSLAKARKAVRLVVRKPPVDVPPHLEIESVVTTEDLFLEDENWWAKICQGIHTVIHVAWYAEPGVYLQSEKNLACLSGSLNLAKGAAAAGVQRFVGIGTCFEYEMTGAVLTTDTPLRPTSLYGAAKAGTFLALSRWCDLHGMSFAWCRLFYLYGADEDPRRLVAHLHAKLSRGEAVDLTSGRQVRDFLDVSEAGDLIVHVALGSQSGAVNICSGIPTTVRQLAEKIADEYGRRDLLRFGAKADNIVDPPYVVGQR